VETIYRRAHRLCQQVGDTPQLFPVLRGLIATCVQRGELLTARAHAEAFSRLAQGRREPALLLEAHRILASIWLPLGAYAEARRHVEHGLGLYDSRRGHQPSVLYAQDPGASCLIYAALLLWHLGYPDQALQRSREALALAQDLAHPHSLAFAHSFVATMHQLRREVHPTRVQAEASIALCQAQGFTFRAARGTILRGWALAAQGQHGEGVAQMRQGLASLRATGIELGLTYFLALLAEGYRRSGQTAEGLTTLAEACAVGERTGQLAWQAELYRLQGEFLVQQDHPRLQQAEACFQRALALARQQQARSWELRAAMSLARLWRQQGRHTAARQIVAAVYQRFTEGFNTVDLHEARVLLDESSCDEPSQPSHSLQRESRPYAG
jgi:predicted ATPase